MMTNNLKLFRVRAKLTQSELAERMGTTRSQYVKLESGKRRLTDQWIRRAAEALAVPAGALLESLTVPLRGSVNGRGEVEALPLTSPREVEAPPESSPSMVALIVSGAPLSGVADEGWLIYYEDRQDPATEALIGALCVIGLPDGRTVVRKLMRGRTPGLYHLHAMGGNPMFDQAVQWAAKVSWIRPR